MELYRSDGTRQGTALVRDIVPGPESPLFKSILPAENQLFLTFSDELWTSDGTEAGTRRIFEMPENNSLGHSQTVAGDVLFFTGGADLPFTELWRSDATAAGTFKVGEAARQFFNPVAVDDRLFVFDITHDGLDLWTSDGSAEGTLKLHGGFDQLPDDTVAYQGQFVFAVGGILWRSDGTPAGTQTVHSFADDAAVPQVFAAVEQFLVVDETLFLLTWSSSNLWEVWKMESPADSPERLLDASLGRFRQLIPFGDRLILQLDRQDEGRELVILRRSQEGIAPLTRTVDPGSGNPSALIANGSRLLFTASGGVYATRGSAASTSLLNSASGSAVSVPAPAGTFVFDRDLWFLDAEDQPRLLLDDNGFSPRRMLTADHSVVVGKELYFLAQGQDFRTEVWRSDGTPAGTEVAASGLPHYPFLCLDPPCRFESVDITSFRGDLLVLHQTALLRVNPASGTVEPVLDTAGMEGCRGFSDDGQVQAYCLVDNLAQVGDRLFFTVAGSVEPMALWTSDGTEQGTSHVFELHPPPSFGYFFDDPGNPELRSMPVRELIGLGGRLYFVRQGAEFGEELWTSDGTAEGTFLVRDIRPGPDSSFPRGLTRIGDQLAFATESGEQRVYDNAAGEICGLGDTSAF